MHKQWKVSSWLCPIKTNVTLLLLLLAEQGNANAVQSKGFLLRPWVLWFLELQKWTVREKGKEGDRTSGIMLLLAFLDDKLDDELNFIRPGPQIALK